MAVEPISLAVMTVREAASNAKTFTESRTRSFRRRCREVPPAALMGASSGFGGFLLCLDLLPPVGHEDCARGCKALHPGGDVHGLPEIVLAVVEAHSETWSLVNADLEQKILVAALGIDVRHRLAHPERSGKSAVRRGKCCHYGIPDCLDNRTRFGSHNFVQYAEMLA